MRGIQRWLIGIGCFAAGWLLPEPLRVAIPVAGNLALAVGFLATLRRGFVPMVTRFAAAERGSLDPPLTSYTRLLTKLWAAAFIGIAALVATVALFRDIRDALWPALAANGLAVATLVTGEFLYRCKRFPQYRHAPPWTMMRIAVNVMLRREKRADPAP